ncbi:uncharacterized protein THITE_2097422 [Thermothielavioides terrestris NRRL 8126]|uniref:Prp 4 CRoW domain-containing protein n=1 Tax=Thermothielavioides terrestris (strain ATCC 38088 / NRRL 8126) TaxID=578455 RepID=G2RDM2_THETT|nr:uncharacterized protein THITE_2097422 [Thermothielavioides terrestris NRRL 8126]AEO70807.1 hypothetical protein THITE_2097422 [Thermothielavioides terrestris NRRL 8126]
MLVKSITAIAALTFAANVAAEPMPYRPSLMKTSVRDLFGRQDPGYQPQQAACGAGDTCAQACGAGYEACAAQDNQVHCYNPAAGEICCPDKSGSSCDAGYYCTADKKGETWCCPEGMDLNACASAYSVVGGLVSQTAPPTSTSTSTSTTSTTTSTTTTSSTSSTSSAAPTTSSPSTTSAPSLAPSSSIFVPSNTTAVTTIVPPKPSATASPTGAGSVVGPASALVFLAAGLAALL